jgi:hypothetical protein
MTNEVKNFKGILAYVHIKEPRLDKDEDPKNPQATKSYEATIIFTDKAEAAKAREFCKAQEYNTKVKIVEASDFEKRFRIPVPEGAGEVLWTLTLRRRSTMGTGENMRPIDETFRPKLLQKVDGKLVDITQDVLVANGSEGIVTFNTYRYKARGQNAIFLQDILVTKLVPYIPAEGEGTVSSFGDSIPETKVLDPVYAEVKEDKPKSEKPTKKAAKAQDDDSDDIPF